MLLNDFFSIKELSFQNENLRAVIKLNPTHAIFEGHFPGNPITPGVAQMQIVKEILEENYKKDLLLKRMSKCKFLQILNPKTHSEIEVIIEVLSSAPELKINAEGRSGETTFFKLSATYLQ